MRRRIAVLLAVAVVVIAAGVGGLLTREQPAEALRVGTGADTFQVGGTGDDAAIVPIHHFRAGRALVPRLEFFAAPAPAEGAAAAGSVANPTHEGFPLVVSVIGQSDDGAWLNVRVPQRPNGTTGWVRAAELELWDVPNRIEVSIPERTLRIYDGDSSTVLFQALVAVGKPSTPTPTGDFFIDIVNPLGHDRVYGWGQLSVAGFSNVLQSFGGGIGQIAIHGWNNPAVMGQNVSNGCVRMNNDDIAVVAALAPLGTPVRIFE